MVLNALLKSLPDLTGRFGRPDFVIASGDIAYSGKADEYINATGFFDRLLSLLSLEKSRLFIVPGNHDVDRHQGVGLARTLGSTADADRYFSGHSKLVHVEHRLRGYAAWYDKYFEGIRSFPKEATFSTEILTVRDSIIGIGLFNSASFCLDDSDSGKLFVGRRCAEAASAEIAKCKIDLSLAVVHHPLHWLSPIESTQIRATINDAFDCLLTGHLHENSTESIAGSSGQVIHLAAGATYQTRDWPNTALICSSDGLNIHATPIRFSDTPRPVWTLDTSLFPSVDNYEGRYPISGRAAQHTETKPTDVTEGKPMDKALPIPTPDTTEILTVRGYIDDRLFTTPTGATVFAPPRLMPRSQTAALEQTGAEAVSVEEIARSASSFIIESRPEYGASTLCRLLQLSIIGEGKSVVFRSARDIPNYRRKLEQDLSADISATSAPRTLILDDFDLERDDRLIGELKESGWFDRVILISVNRRLTESAISDLASTPFAPTVLYLWALGREEIRTFASVVLDANDLISEARAVDKVYTDLLGLRIPLTPSNVLMYLRVLQREGDFEPLSRVDILSRYLAESLRKPSDVASDSFNAKNKKDVLSSFAYHLHQRRSADFDEREWLNFCSSYQSRTLSDFNARDFLNELIEARVLGTYSGGLFFRYRFYYTYFLGRYLWPRPSAIDEFFSSEDYLMGAPVIDVITGLSSENSRIISMLTERLEEHSLAFAEKYVKSDFDPLISAIWPSTEDEQQELWTPVQAAIEKGPANSSEIDELKTSMLAEARTSNQQVTFERYTQLENALFSETWMLGDALKNADDVDGPLKVRAWKTVLQSMLIVVQVGTVFAPALAKKNRFSWGGLTFIDFDKSVEGLEENPQEAMISVITALVETAVTRTSQDYGSVKLAPVFREVAATGKLDGLLSVLNFSCIAISRGKGWVETLTQIIEQTDKTAYYLSEMLSQLLRIMRYEVMPRRDRESLKRLVALIETKRSFNKQSPGAKAVSKTMKLMEDEDYFPEPIDEQVK